MYLVYTDGSSVSNNNRKIKPSTENWSHNLNMNTQLLLIALHLQNSECLCETLSTFLTVETESQNDKQVMQHQRTYRFGKVYGTSTRFYPLLREPSKTKTITKVSVIVSLIQINETTMMFYFIQENTLTCWPYCLWLLALLQISSSYPFKYNKHRNFRKKTGKENP